MLDLVIEHGKVVTPSGETKVDLGIRDGVIVTLGNLGGMAADRRVDARGLLVLPGFIDPHVHLDDFDPSTGLKAPDNIYPLSRAAAFGGNTTLIDFAFPKGDQSPLQALEARRASVDPAVAVDYGVHVGVFADDPVSLADLAALPDYGVSSIKLLMIRPPMTDDFVMLNVMQAAARSGMLVMVHAENAALLAGSQTRLEQTGQLSVHDFPRAHPALAEIEAVQRAILLAGHAGAGLYIVHISSGPAVDQIQAAQRLGRQVLGETATHYLTLTDSIYNHSKGANLVCGPPIRSAQDQARLWQGVQDGTIQTIGSDHCGYSQEQKLSAREDFRSIPKGIAGVETRATMLYSKAVVRGRINLARFVNLTATNPARIFGLYPRKGILAPGSDADICLFDPNYSWTITSSELHFPWGYSPHEGEVVHGKPRTVILRGEVIVQDDEFLGGPGQGTFLPRSTYQA